MSKANSKSHKNIFVNHTFASFFYNKLISREWFSYEDVIKEFEGDKAAKALSAGVSNYENYTQVKKDFLELRELLEKELNCKKSVFLQEKGSNKNKKFRYISEVSDPLAELLKNAIIMKEFKIRKDLEDYFEFCQDSAGFFPASWVEHFFKQTLDLCNIKIKKRDGDELMGSSMERKYENIEYLPKLYEYIRDQKVLNIEYEGGYFYKKELIFHPHYIKEFNGRWYLCGVSDDDSQKIQNLAFDRIKKFRVISKDYISKSNNFSYAKYFSDIVGVTHDNDVQLCTITIRIYEEYMFGLMKTKPIHHTQKTTIEYNKELGYGEVEMMLKPNKEFYGRVLQLGDNLEIISPFDVRNEIAQRIRIMNNRYNQV